MSSNFNRNFEDDVLKEKKQKLKLLAQVIKRKNDKNKLKLEKIETKINHKIEVNEKKYHLKLKKYQNNLENKIKKAKAKLNKKIEIIDQQVDFNIKTNSQSDWVDIKILQLKAKKQFLITDYKTKEAKYNQDYQEKITKLEKWYKEKIEDYQLNLTTSKKDFSASVLKYKSYETDKLNIIYDKKIYHNQYKIQKQELKSQIQIEKNKNKKQELVKTVKNLPFSIKQEYNLSFSPFQVQVDNKKTNLKNNAINFAKAQKNKFFQLRYLSLKDIINFKLFEIPLFIYLVSLIVMIVAIITKTIPKEAMGALAILFLIAIIAGEVFNRVPIWKTFVGGGTMGVFFIGAILGTFNVIPKEIITDVKSFFSAGGFLNLYINVLIVGSILTIPKKLILTSFSGFMFLIASGTIIAVGVGYGFGSMFGLSSDKTILQFLLPLLGDGNGGGVQPLSQMAESYGYMDRGEYMSFALAVSSVSNIFVIIIAACLTAVLTKNPSISGNGKLVKKEVIIRKDNVVAKDRHIAAALFLTAVIYVFCSFLETEVKKSTGVEINVFAWSVVVSLLINIANILPKELKAGADKLHHFFSKQFTWLIMAGVGLTLTDLKIFASLFTNWKYIILILVIDLGLFVGPLLTAKLIKFYTLESMITAGACMGAQGGAGSLAVLGATKRLELLPYSQITCRIGGGIILVIAAPLFMAFTK